MCGSNDFLILHACDLGKLTAIPVERLFCLRLVKKAGEIDGLPFLDSRTVEHANLYEFRVADDFLQAMNTNLRQVFTNQLGQEGEEVHYVFGPAHKAGTKAFVLRSDTYGAGIGVTFAHHHAT